MGKAKSILQSVPTNPLNSQKRDLRPVPCLCLVSRGVAKAAEQRKQKGKEGVFNMKWGRTLDHKTRQTETHIKQ